MTRPGPKIDISRAASIVVDASDSRVSVREENEPAAEWVALDALTPWPGNPRENAKAIAKVAASIKRFGFGAPIVARKADGEIIAGHTRYEAARKLRLDRVPVRFLDLDPADAHLLALADNRLGEFAAWDEPKLLALLGDLRQQSSDAALVAGWVDADIDAMLRNAGDAAIRAGELSEADAFGALPTGGEPETQTMSFRLGPEERAAVAEALARAGQSTPGASLAAVCRAYIGG